MSVVSIVNLTGLSPASTYGGALMIALALLVALFVYGGWYAWVYVGIGLLIAVLDCMVFWWPLMRKTQPKIQKHLTDEFSSMNLPSQAWVEMATENYVHLWISTIALAEIKVIAYWLMPWGWLVLARCFISVPAALGITSFVELRSVFFRSELEDLAKVSDTITMNVRVRLERMMSRPAS